MKPSLPIPLTASIDALMQWVTTVVARFDEPRIRCVVTVTGSGATRTGTIQIVGRSGKRAAHRFLVNLFTFNGSSLETSHAITVTTGIKAVQLDGDDGALALVTDDAGEITFTVNFAGSGTLNFVACAVQTQETTSTW